MFAPLQNSMGGRDVRDKNLSKFYCDAQYRSFPFIHEFAPGAGAPSEPVTSTESVLIDDRGFIYITDKNHGLQILRSDLVSAQ